MKILVNGGLNLSVLDGWWAEAFTPEVGWAIGGAPDSPDGDARDADELFRILEEQVMPAFYNRDAEGVPRRWLARVRASLSRLTPLFSANRMLGEYVARCYRPAEDDLSARSANQGQTARAIDAWADRLRKNWKTLRFGRLETEKTEQGTGIGIEVFFGELSPDDVAVQLHADGEANIPMTNAGTLPGQTDSIPSVLPPPPPPPSAPARLSRRRANTWQASVTVNTPTTRSPCMTTADPRLRSAISAVTFASGVALSTTNTSRVMASSTGTSAGFTPGRDSMSSKSRWLTIPTSLSPASTGRWRMR